MRYPAIVKKASRTDDAYQRIKLEIMENRMPSGFHALESELSENLDMSRTPVHEALIRLQNEGLVEMIPRRGMRVLPLSPADMREIYEVFTLVEPEAAYLLAKKRPNRENLKPLLEAVDEMEKALENDDLDAWSEADNRFHRSLMELCGNQRLADIAFKHMDLAHRARMFTLRLRKRPIRSTEDHKEHVRAILQGEADRVRKIYRQHREQLSKELMELISKFRINNL